jgi:hypothetical protein
MSFSSGPFSFGRFWLSAKIRGSRTGATVGSLGCAVLATASMAKLTVAIFHNSYRCATAEG